MTHILAIANQKGGVGKTTTAVNLAASLAVAEQRTLLIDGDPQGNATSGIGLARESLGATVYDILIGEASASDARHRGVQFKHLDVLPATPDLAGAEIELINRHRRDQAMRDALTAIADDYDYILIDCPPSLGLITVNMLAAADALIIPVQCEYYALEGLSQLLNTVHLVQQSVNPELSIEGVLLTMYDARLNLSRQVAVDAREYFGPKVYESVIPRNVRLAEAPSFGKPIILYDLTSAGAQAYMSVAKELLMRHRPQLRAHQEAPSAARSDARVDTLEPSTTGATLADRPAAEPHGDDRHGDDRDAPVRQDSHVAAVNGEAVNGQASDRQTVDADSVRAAAGEEIGDAETGDAETGDAETGDAETGDAETGDAETGRAEVSFADVDLSDIGYDIVDEAQARVDEGGEAAGTLETGDLETGDLETGDLETGDLDAEANAPADRTEREVNAAPEIESEAAGHAPIPDDIAPEGPMFHVEQSSTPTPDRSVSRETF